jgi:hypothetical protein
MQIHPVIFMKPIASNASLPVPSVAARGSDLAVSPVVVGIAIVAFVPALFWTGLLWIGLMAAGTVVTGTTLVTVGCAIATFLGLVGCALFARN